MDNSLVTQSLMIAATIALLATLPGTAYLALLTLAAMLPPRRAAGQPLPGRIAIVVPAHNEAAGLPRTLANLLPLAAADGATDVFVIADNCTDDTAGAARQAGAWVIERHDPERPGKGFALDHAFRYLARAGHVAFVVVDADSSVADNFLSSLRQRLGAGALAVQACYGVRNADASPRTRLAAIALAAFNVLRPRGRARLGLSAGILGNGFALHRDALARVPYQAASVVEDLEYHLRLVAAGIPVVFAYETTVLGDMPTGDDGNSTQRARWEGGRLRMLREHGAAMAWQILRGRLRMVEPLADLLLLPLAQHVLLLLACLALATLVPGVLLPALAVGSLALVAWHVAVTMRVGGVPWQYALALLRVPAYLIWKLGTLAGTLANARRNAEWVRTNRTGA